MNCVMKLLVPIVRIISMVVNLSGVASGILLLCLGEWRLALWVFLFNMFSHYTVSYLCIIHLAPLLLIGMAEKINRLLAKWLGVLLLPIFIVAIPLEVAMFGTLVFDLFYFPNLGHISIYPLLLLALSSGTTPWLYLAQKEKTTEALCSAIITEIVFFVVCLVMLFTPIQLLTIFLMLFIGQLLFPLITILAKVHIRKKQGMGIFLYDIILALRGYIHKS